MSECNGVGGHCLFVWWQVKMIVRHETGLGRVIYERIGVVPRDKIDQKRVDLHVFGLFRPQMGPNSDI